jgi:hypothetical protein
MTKLGELSEDFYIEYFHQLPQIDVKNIRLLWHNGYWDMPLDGILLYNGRPNWFKIFHALRIDEVRNRVDPEGIVWNDHFVRYLVVELSDEQIKEEEYWHDLFRQKVGTHTNYDENGQRKIGELRPRELWNDFYERHKRREARDFSHNLVIGWFEELVGSIKQEDDNNDDESIPSPIRR